MAELPTGTVTFLFTDIEGSTALARMELEEPPAALAFHRLMVQLLGERATHLMRTVQALQR